jgi:hypothetical protein
MTSASSFSVLTSQKCNHKLICLCYALDPSPLEGIDSLGEIYAGFKYLCFSGSCGFRRNHRPFAKCCSSPSSRDLFHNMDHLVHLVTIFLLLHICLMLLFSVLVSLIIGGSGCLRWSSLGLMVLMCVFGLINVLHSSNCMAFHQILGSLLHHCIW